MPTPEDEQTRDSIVLGPHTVVVSGASEPHSLLNVEIHAHPPRNVVCHPGVIGGEPVIEGTRIPIKAIVLMTRRYSDMGAVLRALPTLHEKDVWTALAYYEVHRAEIDGCIAADEQSDREPL